jgi:hypothetical protein
MREVAASKTRDPESQQCSRMSSMLLDQIQSLNRLQLSSQDLS